MKLASLDADTVAEGHYRQLGAEEVAKLGRAVDRALTEHTPLPKGFKPRREWRPREEILKKAAGKKGQGVDNRNRQGVDNRKRAAGARRRVKPA
jgi:hypothetical protein